MGFLKSKGMIIIQILTVLLVTLYYLGKKSVHHEILISASPEKVWSILIDTQKYDKWNPVMKLLEGEVKEGNKVKYQFTQDADNVSEIPSKVKKVIPNELLNQGGGMPILLTFDHRYKLEPAGDWTKLIIHEDYRGIGVNFWNPAPVEAAYGRLNEAIKKRAETL